MKRKIGIVIIILLIGSFIGFSCSSKDSGEWVAKIDGDTISLNTLNSFYYAQQKSIYNESKENIDQRAVNPDEVEKNPTLNKQEFLENLIRQRLVYNKAVEEGVMKNEEVNSLIEMAKEAVVVGFFVKEKYKNEINISEEEISRIYSQQKEKFKGVPIDQAEQYINQQLSQQKLQMKLRELVETLKEVGIIEKNLNLLTTPKNEQQKESKQETKEDVQKKQ